MGGRGGADERAARQPLSSPPLRCAALRSHITARISRVRKGSARQRSAVQWHVAWQCTVPDSEANLAHTQNAIFCCCHRCVHVVFLFLFLFPVCADNTIEPITAYEAVRELMSTTQSIRRAAGAAASGAAARAAANRATANRAGIRRPREEDPQAALDEERELRTPPEMPARRIFRAQRQR